MEWRISPRDPRYLVSSDGAVRGPSGRILRQDVQWTGYLRVSCGRKTVKVHRVVCEAFHGAPPTLSHVPNHLNGIKTDNRAANLAWATPAENRAHASKLGLLKGQRAGLKRDKLSIELAREIRRKAATQSHLSLAREYNITNTMVGYIVQNRYWRERTAPVAS